MLNREEQRLLHTKQNRGKTGVGLPSDREGSNGDIWVREVNGKITLCAKYNNTWRKFTEDTTSVAMSSITPLSQTSDYDSGWFTLNDHNGDSDVLTKTHNLDYQMPIIHVYAKLTATQVSSYVAGTSSQLIAGAIYPLSINMHDNTGSYNIGTYIQFTDVNSLKIVAGNDGIFAIDNINGGAYGRVHQCEVRILLWKLGASV